VRAEALLAVSFALTRLRRQRRLSLSRQVAFVPKEARLHHLRTRPARENP